MHCHKCNLFFLVTTYKVLGHPFARPNCANPRHQTYAMLLQDKMADQPMLDMIAQNHDLLVT